MRTNALSLLFTFAIMEEPRRYYYVKKKDLSKTFGMERNKEE